MGMPSININFSELAASVIKRGERGIVAMILKDDATVTNPIKITSVTDIPAALSTANQEQIKLALMGYVHAPKQVIAYVIAEPEVGETADYTSALNYFKTVKFDYLVAPTATTDAVTSDLVNYVKTEREAGKLIKAVLPNVTADTEGVINYTTSAVYVDSAVYTTEQYCARIAGILAGTPLEISATYAPLVEATDCTRLSKSDMDAAVDAGKLIVWFDGEKVKVGRAVNSLTTLTDAKNTQFQKIKIVETMDIINDDLKKSIEDNYIGKYPNTYDNKCLLISAVGNYFESLVNDDVLSSYTIGIDIDANKAYLRGKGVDVDNMSDDEIKVADTGSNVYLTATVHILDAIEDVTLNIAI